MSVEKIVYRSGLVEYLLFTVIYLPILSLLAKNIKPEGKRLLEKPRSGWKIILKWVLKHRLGQC
jgi:hypothetical protein